MNITPCNSQTDINLTFDIENNQIQNNQASTFCSKMVKVCKKIPNYLVNIGFALGGVGVMLGAFSHMPTIASQVHVNASSICAIETEAKIKAYDEQMLEANILSGLFGALIPTLLMGVHYFGEKRA